MRRRNRRLRFLFTACAALLLCAAVAPAAEPTAEKQGSARAAVPAWTVKAPEPVRAKPEAAPFPLTDAGARTALNLLGEVDSRGGESRRNENVRLTLIDNNVLKELNRRMGTTATIIREYKVEQSYFGNEFGGQPQRPLHVDASSVSDFHGQFFWGHNNRVFSARSFFQVGKVQPARTNDYGFALAVPLGERTFLSVGGSQRKLRGQVNGNVLVPAADERTPLATDPATRELVSQILAAFPATLPNRIDIDPRALNTNAPQLIDNDNVRARLDQNLSDADRLTLLYQFTSQTVEAFQLVAGQNPDTRTKSHDARLTWTRTWSPATSTEFSTGFRRVGSLLVADQAWSGPLISAGSVVSRLGPGLSIPINRARNRTLSAGRLRHIRGDHQWTAGFELGRQQVNGFESNLHSGVFSFRNDFGRDAITNLRQGTASSYSVSIGNVHRGFRNWDSQFYIGDAWRATAKLTLHLGLRYQMVTVPDEVNNLNSFPYSCDCNNLAPRFGFAYRAGAGVLRGAYGVQYGEIFPVAFSQIRFNPPGNRRLGIQTPDLVDPLAGLNTGNLDPDTPATTFEFSPNFVTPYSHQYNFSWEIPVARNWPLVLGYIGSRSHKLLALWAMNRAVPKPGFDQTTSTVNARRPQPEFLERRQILNGSRSYFDAAKATLRVPRWKGLSIEGSYWFSKAIDLGSDYTTTTAEPATGGAESQFQFDVHGDLKALSNFDQPHAALIRLVHEAPRLAGRPAWIRQTLGGWEFSGVVLFKKGTPFSVLSGSDAPGFGNVDGSTSDRPNVVGPEILGRTVDNPDTSAAALPRSAFEFIRPQERAGNLGRNTFRKDGIRNINAALSRRWPLGGERAVTLRAESINLFNTPQFAQPGTSLADPNFGRITNTLNDGRTFRFFLQFGF